jgi:hypothetical protein
MRHSLKATTIHFFGLRLSSPESDPLNDPSEICQNTQLVARAPANAVDGSQLREAVSEPIDFGTAEINCLRSLFSAAYTPFSLMPFEPKK